MVSPRVRAKFASGDKLGSFEIEEEISGGGFGNLFLARGTSGEQAILKVPRRVGMGTIGSDHIIREQRALEILKHENIVRLLDSGNSQGNPWLAIEHICGQTLQEKRPDLEKAQIINLATQAATGLAYAHSQGVTHGDFHPENILVTAGLRLKLVDFGLSHCRRLGQRTVWSRWQEAGQPTFMAPEQCWGGPIDARSDVFSFGCVLAWLLTGRGLFDRGESLSPIEDRRESRPDQHLLEELPAHWKRLVTECIRDYPQDRPQSMVEVEREVREIAEFEASRRNTQQLIDRTRTRARPDPIESLVDEIDEHFSSGGHLVLVRGRTGTGKTRLANLIGRRWAERLYGVMALPMDYFDSIDPRPGAFPQSVAGLVLQRLRACEGPGARKLGNDLEAVLEDHSEINARMTIQLLEDINIGFVKGWLLLLDDLDEADKFLLQYTEYLALNSPALSGRVIAVGLFDPHGPFASSIEAIRGVGVDLVELRD